MSTTLSHQSDDVRIWTWRQAILQSDLPPITRFVLLTLACFMNDMGGGCYPTIERLVECTGLSKRAIQNHLASVAVDEGDTTAPNRWLRVKRHGFGGRRWRNNEYRATWPTTPEGDVSGSSSQRSDGQQGGAPDAPRHDQGGASDDHEVVHQVHPISPKRTNPPYSPPQGGDCPDNDHGFEELIWNQQWEREDGHVRRTALSSWRRLDQAERKACADAVRWYRDKGSASTKPRYRFGLTTFIRDQRWQGREEEIARYAAILAQPARISVQRKDQPELYRALEILLTARRTGNLKHACCDQESWSFEPADIETARKQVAQHRDAQAGGCQ
jgi:helix-turn-helix protein